MKAREKVFWFSVNARGIDPVKRRDTALPGGDFLRHRDLSIR
jgi:hypothetical protein